MKQRFWLFTRSGVFYLQDSVTGKKESLQTRDRKHAERLRSARNEAADKPLLGLSLGKAYLAAYDPMLVQRTWQLVMDEFLTRGKDSSRQRRERAMRCEVFNSLRDKKLVETTSDDLRRVLADSRTSTNHFLHCLHNLAVGLGWLPWPLIAPKLWPVALKKKRRAITAEEHQKIIAAENNLERRNFYALLWEIGAAQTDTASLTAEQIDWNRRVLTFRRCKTGSSAHFIIGERLEELLRQLPQSGPLFPALSRSNASARSAEFCRRCRLLEIKGVSLHSYRYAWAQRAKCAGYPARWAQDALGHNSRAVHEFYAEGAQVLHPPLEDYEKKIVPLMPGSAHG